jgi:hypothetical protein
MQKIYIILCKSFLDQKVSSFDNILDINSEAFFSYTSALEECEKLNIKFTSQNLKFSVKELQIKETNSVNFIKRVLK